MKPILTPAQAADLDRESQARGIETSRLMENAGRAVAQAAADVTDGVYGRRAVVVCGRGNNGGDGFVAARFLSEWGMRVTVVLLADPNALRDPAAGNYSRLAAADVRVRGLDALERELQRADVVVDALVGTGFRGRPENDFASAIADVNDSGVPVIAADIPSGVNGETGEVEGEAVWAEVTVTFGAAKPGVILFPGAERAGIVQVADIGFPKDLIESDLLLVEESDVAEMLPVREPDTSKRATGVVLVVGGSRTMTGAVCLVAEAAYRAGAGLVTVAAPEGIIPIVESAVTEATFVPLPETAEGGVAPDALRVLWDRLGSFDAFAVGPGLGTQEETQEAARGIAAAVPAPLVLDADGLNAFAGRAAELTDRGTPEVVLTPHAGEFSRLSGKAVEEIERDRVAAVRDLVKTTEATVLLKGSRTLIGGHGGEVRVNATGSSALATAGSGDVLTGTIASLLSRGLGSLDAATAGAYVHGLAGLLAERELGEGTTARAVLERLPAAIKGVLES